MYIMGIPHGDINPIYLNGCFLKWWHPKTMAFNTNNRITFHDFGYPYFRKPQYIADITVLHICSQNPVDFNQCLLFCICLQWGTVVVEWGSDTMIHTYVIFTVAVSEHKYCIHYHLWWTSGVSGTTVFLRQTHLDLGWCITLYCSVHHHDSTHSHYHVKLTFHCHADWNKFGNNNTNDNKDTWINLSGKSVGPARTHVPL